MRPVVAIATCREMPEPDPDEELLLDALRGAELEPRQLAWDEASSDFAAASVVVLRSTWNYHRHLDDFLGWIDALSKKTRVVNPAAVVRWNAHKRYLLDLEARGVRTVPTLFVDRGAQLEVREQVETLGWNDVVVKPAVSAGSFQTKRFKTRASIDDAWVSALVAQRDVMIQPYVKSVDGWGERAVVWIDDALTHAVRKTARFAGQAEVVSEALDVASDEDVIARAAIDAAREATGASALLYGRVDIMRDRQGAPMVSELELIEPSLFLQQSEDALRRFVAAIAALAR